MAQKEPAVGKRHLKVWGGRAKKSSAPITSQVFLYCDGSSAFFTAEHAAKDPFARINSVGLVIPEYVQSEGFTIIPLEQQVPNQRSNALLSG